MRKRKPVIIALLTFSAVGLLDCTNEPPPPTAPPMPRVNVATVVPQTILDEPEFIGQTAAFRPVEIRSQGFEYHLLVIGMCVALVLAGAGKWSVDQEIAKRLPSD